MTFSMDIDMYVVNMNLVDFLGGFYVILPTSNFDKQILVRDLIIQFN